MNNKTKIQIAILLELFLVVTAQHLNAQTNSIPVPPLPEDLTNPNIMVAMWGVVIRNPASSLAIPFLSIIAWLIDDTPFINSRYVTHISTVIGAAVYWLFATPASVPKSFPYPWWVLIVNGVICGFIAGIGHRWIIARFINFARAKFGDSFPPAATLKPVEPGNNDLLLKQQQQKS